MKKKSQTSIFLIISATIILALIAIFVLSSANNKAPISKSIVIANSIVPEQVRPYIDNCMTNASHEALWAIAVNGGYFNISGLQQELYSHEYHYYEGIYLVPADSVVEEELAVAFNLYVVDCIANIQFPEGIILKKEGTISSEVFMYNSSVVFSMKYPLSVTIGEVKRSFDTFSKTVDSIRLKKMFDISRELVTQQLENQDDVCVSCTSKLAEDNGLYIDLEYIKDNEIVYYISDPNFYLDDEMFTLTTVHKHE